MIGRWWLAVAPLLLSGAAPPGHYEGATAAGSRWAVEVPPGWNGTLLLHSRGGNPGGKDPPVLAPRGAADTLLAHGYAIAGTSYATPGWNPKAAAELQFLAIPAIVAAIGRPKHVVNLGTSYGGGVGAQEAERTTGQIDGTVTTCGLIVGGVDLMNAQLDSLHAIATLLSPAAPIRIVGLRDTAGVKASADALTAAAKAALATPQGRARLALAAALMHVPEWHDGAAPPADVAERAAQQAAWLTGPPGFGFIQGSRLDIETQAGGNPSWNAGVDYAALLTTNASRPLVDALYRAAGLDLAADLARLTRAATIAADPAALAWMRDTSVPSGALRVPMLAMQTTGDPVAPPEFLTLYAARVAARRQAALLRTVAVARPGHCQFLPGEILAAVDALRARLETGRWDARATPAALDADAGAGAAFVPVPARAFISRDRPKDMR